MRRCLFLLILAPLSIFADEFMDAMEIAKAGNKFQSERLKVITENIANEQTTGIMPGEDPYTRKVVFAKNKFDKKKKLNLVKLKKIARDKKQSYSYRYQPNHPAADERGLVKYPNVNRLIEKADSMEAQKSYEAGISMIETSKSMVSKTLEILK